MVGETRVQIPARDGELSENPIASFSHFKLIIMDNNAKIWNITTLLYGLVYAVTETWAWLRYEFISIVIILMYEIDLSLSVDLNLSLLI